MAASQAWPRQYDPTGFCRPFLIWSRILVNGQFWPTLLFMRMIRENGGMSGGKKLVRKGREETLVCSEGLSCCSQEPKISQVSRWMRMKEQEEQNSYQAIDAAT